MNSKRICKFTGLLAGALLCCSSCTKDPGHALYANARNEFDSGEYEPASQGFSKLVQQVPEHAAGFYYRGQCNQALGKFDAAIDDYTQPFRCVT